MCFALLLMDGMSELAARYAVHQHEVAKLDSFHDHAGFLPLIRAAAQKRYEARQLRTQRVTHAFWAALFVVMVFGGRTRSQGHDSSGRPAEDPDGRHGPDGPKAGAAHDVFDGQTTQGGYSDSHVVAPSWAGPPQYVFAAGFRSESCLGGGRVLPQGSPSGKSLGASEKLILGMHFENN